MKHFLFFVFSSVFTVSIYSQQLDTTTNYKFINNALENDSRTINSYNSSCVIDSTIVQTWISITSTWRNSSRSVFSYTNGIVTEVIEQSWDTNANTWLNTFRLSYTYNTKNLLTLSLNEKWDGTSGQWVGMSRTTNSYNESNLLDSAITEIDSLGIWQNSALIVNKYDSSGLIDSTINEIWSLVTWINSSLKTYTYKRDKTIDQTIYQTWDTLALSWVNQYRNTYTYNGSKLMFSDTAQKWNVTQWNDTSLVTNTYTALNVLATMLLRKSSDNGVNWINNTRTNYTYNGPSGAMDAATSQIFDTVNNDWLDSTETAYHYILGCTLPVTLLDFTATLNGKTAQLQWITSTEINTKNFIVQRSIDGIHFNSIGSVNAVDGMQKNSYNFDDAGALNAGANKLYYRLQIIDKDGKFTYSKIATVQIVNSRLVIIYPNPVKDQLVMTTQSSLNNSQIRIINQNGQVVYQQQVASMLTGTTNKINVSGFNKGIYYLQLITKDDLQVIKFLKY